MKATGMTRPVDALGRVVVPIEIRRSLGIVPGDPLEVFVQGRSVVLRKYLPGCLFCGSADRLAHLHGLPVCARCAADAAGRVRAAAGD